MEQIERINIVSLDTLTSHTHHEEEIHESMGCIAGLSKHVEIYVGKRSPHIPASDPFDSGAIELRIWSVGTKLPGPAEFQLEVAGANNGDA